MSEHRSNAFPPGAAYPPWEPSLNSQNDVLLPHVASIKSVHDTSFQYCRFLSSSHSRSSNTKYHNPYLSLFAIIRRLNGHTLQPTPPLIFSFTLPGPKPSPHL